MKKITLSLAVLAMAGVASASLLQPNGDFELLGADWGEAGGGSAAVFAYPETGGSDLGTLGGALNGGYGSIQESGGGWAILVNADNINPAAGGGATLAEAGVTAGAVNTFTVDLKTFAGAAAGGMKVEFWGGTTLLDNTGDVNAPASFADGNWNQFTFDFAVPAGTDGVMYVPLWGAGSTVGYDNIGVVPEPATLGLLGLAGGGLLFFRRHFRV